MMGEAKFAIISRHVILPEYLALSAHQSSFAILFIAGDTLVKIKLLKATYSVRFRQVSDLIEKYSVWNPINYENFYVSPGLIDCNVVSNPSWEGRAKATKAAVSGGVTMMLEEPSLYRQQTEEETCFCDVGKIERLDNLGNFDPGSTAFAYKIYLYPPSAEVSGFLESLEDLFDKIIQTALPLFIDPCFPASRMLYMASPYRHSSLEERVSAAYVDESEFGAGAYQEEAALFSGSENEKEEQTRPDRSQSSVDVTSNQLFRALPRKLSPVAEESLWSRRQRRVTEDLASLSKPNSQLPNIFSDLNKRISDLQGSQSDLSLSEQMQYDQAGRYVYNGSSSSENEIMNRKRSNSSTGSVPSVSSPDCSPSVSHAANSPGILKKIKHRPKCLTIEKKHVEDSKEREYIFHLANCPDHWEINGVDKVLHSLRKAPCRVHFCNISSAAAVNKVRKFKEKGFADSATVETSPNYLFFTKDDVGEGDTRLKTFPPIRNKTNCNLLWELLRVKAIDIVASHHIAVPSELKFLDSGNFKKALNGILTLGYGLQALWTKLRMPAIDGQIVRETYLVQLAKWMSFNPARLIGVAHKRGSIEKGKYADLVVWSPDEEYQVDGDLSPYAGKSLYGRIHAVYVRGKLAFDSEDAYPVGKLMHRSDFLR